MKNLFFILVVIFCGSSSFAQEKTFQLSTHILDISEGMPAAHVSVKLEKLEKLEKSANSTEKWQIIDQKQTFDNGRINDFLPFSEQNNGIYRFTFYVADYYKEKGKESFYPFIEVVFKIDGDQHYHVPITLSAFGYSTYKGS